MNTEIKYPVLTDAQNMAKQHQVTFAVPEWAALHSLKTGDFVKICCMGERFWVEITRITPHWHEGTVDNKLVNTEDHQLIEGDLVAFEAKNVYAILKHP